MLTPISRERSSTDVLSGGSSLATALFMNSCPYRATLRSHVLTPFILGSIWATTILTQGAGVGEVNPRKPSVRTSVGWDMHTVSPDIVTF
ncbi:hypothetical protein [Undibacterium sp. WLX3042]|uniref:hypothetical protein n=1 Tax=Undibacterium sp. WLX3042 TaxID=3412686 RepID=UPI003C2BD7B3